MTIPTDPATIIAIGAMFVSIIGASAAAVVSVIKSLTEMKSKVSSIEQTVHDVHSAVNSGAVALKEQNERLAKEAIQVATAKADEAYAKGLAEGKLSEIYESRKSGDAIPVLVVEKKSKGET